jgi:MscS family membrane protein
MILLMIAMAASKLAGIIFHSMSGTPDRFHVVQPSTLPVFEIASKVFVFGGAAYFIMLSWKLDPTGWLASAGIVGIAVGFAAKDTLANLFAGVFILADAPYKVGDFIELEGQRGQVTKIGLRSTRILTRDDIEITIPNSTIANSKIINESGGPSIKHRIRIPIGVAYGSDVDQVRAVLESAILENEDICSSPEPRVRFRSFGDSSLNFEVLGWIEDPSIRGRVTDSLNTAIYKALGKAGIEIPFPKRDVYIRQSAPPRKD